MINFQLKEQFKVEPDKLYKAWLDSDLHAQMTGGEAQCSDQVGESFSAWDGYISGENIRLTPNKEIVQSWRTTEFKESDTDSELRLIFEPNDEGCLVQLIHTNIPDGQPDYAQGWVEHYFNPMKESFNK